MVKLQTFLKLYFLLPFLYSSTQSPVTLLDIERSENWSYANTEDWGTNYPECNGKRQSPINLSLAYSLSLLPIRFANYFISLSGNVTLFNNGKTVEFLVPVTANGQLPSITGGIMRDIYEAYNVHFHWGSEGNNGSEHTVKTNRFDVEMHIVHRNIKYETMEQALNSSDGVAVLGIFFQIVNDPIKTYPGLDKVFNTLPEVIDSDSEADIDGSLTLGHLLGDLNTKHFYTYKGSLTTPPCSEAVTWTVFTEPLPIANEQIMKFFAIRDVSGNPLLNNYRPLQERNNRPIFYRQFV